MLSPVQTRFLNLLMARDALRFGDFTLKSGRRSPYFINTGCFHHGSDLQQLGSCYAEGLRAHFGAGFDCIFGPAYKGIPLALAAAQAMQASAGRDVGWAYDRKEAKTHGDAGSFVGMPLEAGRRVVVVDDVLTAGTALRETLHKLALTGVEVVGALVSVDREEAGPTGRASARQEMAADHGLPVHALIGIREAADALLADQRIDAELHARIHAQASHAL